MEGLYEPQPCYTFVPKTMERVIDELFNPPGKQPFFKGYEPNLYFKRVNPLRSDKRHEWESK